MTTDPNATLTPQWTVSDRLRKAREHAGLEQIELAQRVGIARNSVSNYERGVTSPKRPVLLSWAMACGVPLVWLQTGESPRLGNDGASADTGDRSVIRELLVRPLAA